VSAIAPPQAVPSSPAPPRRPVGVVLYLLLSLALAGMVALSFWVNLRVQGSLDRAVAASDFWAPRFGMVSSLGAAATTLDAPGNQVFLDRDLVEARTAFHIARDSFAILYRTAVEMLPESLPPEESVRLLTGLARVDSTVVHMVAHSDSLFREYAAGNEVAASRHMAQMDGEFGSVLRGLRSLRAEVSAVQDARIRELRGEAAAASIRLRWMGLALLLLAVGGGWLGFRLTREAAVQARAREVAHAEVVHAQQDLELAHAQLMAAHQEMETFSYTVAHDLRSPLRSINGFAEALEQDSAPQLDEVGRGHITKIRTAATRMSNLIDELMKLSKLTRQSLVSAPVDLGAMAVEVITELRTQEPSRQVAVTVAAGLVADGDPALLRAVLQNLLGNAWKFTRHTAEPRIELFVEPQPGGAAPVFVVRDNGAGFDLAFARKLFIAFQRMHTQSEFEGTGVGLATVQRIVQRHGGRVWAEAAVGQGATFRFTLRP
jgi:signal transduction histidine kinase